MICHECPFSPRPNIKPDEEYRKHMMKYHGWEKWQVDRALKPMFAEDDEDD